MRVKSIKVENFKNFDQQHIELNDFNLFVGANASAKYNFINLIKFFENIKGNGFFKAIGELGGFRYFKNINCYDEPFKLRIEFYYDSYSAIFKDSCVLDEFFIITNIQTLIYEFIIDIEVDTINIIHDELYMNGISKSLCSSCTDLQTFIKDHNLAGNNEGIDMPRFIKEYYDTFDEFSIKLLNTGLKTKNSTEKDVEIKFKGPDYLNIDDFVRVAEVSEKKAKGMLILESYIFEMLTSNIEPFKITTYDFKPNEIRESTLKEKQELEEDGKNLPISIANILKDEEKTAKFYKIINTVMPFVESINIIEELGGTVLFEVKEKSSGKKISSNCLSDEMINLIAIIVALFFEDNDVVVLDKPERFIQPDLISSIVSLLNDKAGEKQIIVATDSSEVVKYSGVDQLLFVSQDVNGTSKITRLEQSDDLKAALEKDFEAGDLVVEDVLEEFVKC